MMRHFLNLFAALIICSWTADCSFNDDGGSSGGVTTNSRSAKGSSTADKASETGLYELALRISSANQARWDEYSRNLTNAERIAEYPAFIAGNPVDVDLIYEQLKKEARSREKDLI